MTYRKHALPTHQKTPTGRSLFLFEDCEKKDKGQFVNSGRVLYTEEKKRKVRAVESENPSRTVPRMDENGTGTTLLLPRPLCSVLL